MSSSSCVLINQPGRVFETTGFGQQWTAGHAEGRIQPPGDGIQPVFQSKHGRIFRHKFALAAQVPWRAGDTMRAGKSETAPC